MRVPEQSDPFELDFRSFVEAGVSSLNFTADSSASQLGGTIRGGLAFNRVFAVEADFSVLEDSSGLVIGSGSSVGSGFTQIREPDQVSGVFARAAWPLGDRLSAHARLGYARLDAENELGSDESAGGAAFGAGASISLWGATAIRLDYTRMAMDELDANVGTLAFALRF
jgi:hypothetical protein